MRSKLVAATVFGWITAAFLLTGINAFSAQAADLKFEAFLLWGTNDAKPPEGRHYKPVIPEVKSKLAQLPLKWTNWFEVNKKSFTLAPGASTNTAMSSKCDVSVKDVGNSHLEVTLIGKGKQVMKRIQSLPRGEMLVLGGNAPNSTAWLVVLKRIQ